MIYDFIEIGSCDFETLLQSCKDEEKGITVEPIRKYLENLPERQNVKKVCAAMVSEFTEDLDIYFVDEAEYDDDFLFYPGKRLPWYLKGCNSVSKPHDYHLACPENLLVAERHGRDYANYVKTTNLLELGLVKVEKCRCITFADLVRENEVSYVKKIKLDVEGQDTALLTSILDFYEKTGMSYPVEIQFESNIHSNPSDVDRICDRLFKLGYAIKGWDGKNYQKDLLNCVAILDKNRVKRLEELKQIHRMHDNYPGPASYVGGLIDLVKKHLSSNSILCEIGSYRGVSTEIFANFCKLVYSVDIWDGVKNQNDNHNDNHPLLPEDSFDLILSNYSNIVKIKDWSSEASKKFEDNSLDAVYIDGDHSFEGFTNDMNYWVPKVKNGGIIMGHDWILVHNWITNWVNHDNIEVFSDSSWVFRKP